MKKDKILKKLPWILLIFVYLSTFLFIYFKCRGYIDSDIASEMILANKLNKEGSILSKNWFYSTELRVLYLQVIYRLTLLIFPNNWYLAMVLGNAILVLILILVFLFLCNKNGLNLKDKGLVGVICLACPFSIWYFWYGAFGGAYLPHMIITLTSLALFVHSSKNNIYICLNVMLAFISGIGGVKNIMGIYIPLVFALFILLIYKIHKKESNDYKTIIRLLIFSILIFLASAIGYYINSNILSNIYTFSSEHKRWWSSFNINLFIENISDLLSLLGVLHPKYWDTEVSLFSTKGILGCFAYITIIIFIISLFVSIRRFNKLHLNKQIALAISISAIFIQASILSFTDGNDPKLPYYWLTIIPLLFVIIEIGIENIDYSYNYSKYYLETILVISIICTSVSSVKTFMDKPLRAKTSLEKVADFLKENNYTQGMANFWEANIITEWSDGDIEMWVLIDEYSQISQWLQDKDHLNAYPDGQLFLLTTHDELSRLGLLEMYENSKVIYEDIEGDIVFLYDTYNDFLIDYWYARELNEDSTSVD